MGAGTDDRRFRRLVRAALYELERFVYSAFSRPTSDEGNRLISLATNAYAVPPSTNYTISSP